MDILQAAEQSLSWPIPATYNCRTSAERIVAWLDRQPRDANGGAGLALEKLCHEALRTKNGGVFWPALLVAGWGRVDTGWLPRGDLAYLVEATARALARRWRVRAVTVSEAADVLGYSEVHVRRLIKAGKLGATRVPGKPTRWEVTSEDVYKYKLAA